MERKKCWLKYGTGKNIFSNVSVLNIYVQILAMTDIFGHQPYVY